MYQRKVEQQKEVTKQELLDEADRMFSKAKKMVKAAIDARKIFEHLQTNHREFSLAYPTVIARMALGEYSQFAFSKFITWVVHNPWTTEEKWLAAQAMYTRMLFKSLNREAPEKDCRAVYDITYAKLTKEAEEFKKDLDAIKKEEESNKEGDDSEYKQELAEWVRENREQLRNALKKNEGA